MKVDKIILSLLFKSIFGELLLVINITASVRLEELASAYDAIFVCFKRNSLESL